MNNPYAGQDWPDDIDDHQAGDVLQHGSRMILDMPVDHPWLRWLASSGQADQLEHGALRVSLGDTLQRFDLIAIGDINYTLNVVETEWRMCGSPTPGILLTAHKGRR